MNVNSRQNKSSISNFYISTSIFHKNQIKQKSIGNILQASLKNISNYNQTQYLPEQKNTPKKQQLKRFLISSKSNKTPQKQLSMRHVKTSIKVEKSFLSPMKTKKQASEIQTNNFTLQKFGSKSEAKNKNIRLERSKDKMFESEVKSYNQSNIYNLLKKIKNHKDQMSRQQQFSKVQIQDRQKINEIDKDYRPISFVEQKQINLIDEQTQLKRLQIQRIETKLMNKQINNKNISIFTDFQKESQNNKFIYKESPINNLYNINGASPSKNQSFVFFSSYLELKQYLQSYSQTSKQSITEIEDQIKRQQSKREQTIQNYASTLKSTLFNIVQNYVQNWKQMQKILSQKIIQPNIFSIQQLKDQLFQKTIFLDQCIQKLKNIQDKDFQVKRSIFYSKNNKNNQQVKQVYKNIFNKTLGSEVDKYIDQIIIKLKNDLEQLKSNNETTKDVFTVTLAQKLKNQLKNFQILCQNMNKKNVKEQIKMQIQIQKQQNVQHQKGQNLIQKFPQDSNHV